MEAINKAPEESLEGNVRASFVHQVREGKDKTTAEEILLALGAADVPIVDPRMYLSDHEPRP